MNKNSFKFWVDIAMFLDFLVLATSGFILKYVYPAGQKSGSAGVKFLFDRFGWLLIHDYVAFGLVGLILLHLILNWPWIKAMFKKTFRVS
jgi:hypothetical protein